MRLYFSADGTEHGQCTWVPSLRSPGHFAPLPVSLLLTNGRWQGFPIYICFGVAILSPVCSPSASRAHARLPPSLHYQLWAFLSKVPRSSAVKTITASGPQSQSSYVSLRLNSCRYNRALNEDSWALVEVVWFRVKYLTVFCFLYVDQLRDSVLISIYCKVFWWELRDTLCMCITISHVRNQFNIVSV